MKKYVIVTTWNGEGYSEENKIVCIVECLPSEIKQITRLTLAQNEDIGTVADCEELEKENGFVFSSTGGDDGTYQFFELTEELHSFMIDINVNEVTPLKRGDYIANAGLFGFSHLDTEARHFVAAEEHNYTLTENDVQFIVVDHSPQKNTTEKEVVLTPLERRLIERLNSCHQVIDSAAETIAEWFSNKDERGDIYIELLAELAPTEELLREVEGIKGWTCTDPDTNQYMRRISENIFEYKEDRNNEVFQMVIDITKYKYKEIDSIVSSYGYDLLSSYKLDGYLLSESKMLIAECIFEQE